jgi:hypothetical protein
MLISHLRISSRHSYVEMAHCDFRDTARGTMLELANAIADLKENEVRKMIQDRIKAGADLICFCHRCHLYHQEKAAGASKLL